MKSRTAEPMRLAVSVTPAGGAPVYEMPGGRGLEFPIQAFVGPNGSGKSLALVEMAVLPAWKRGIVAVSNMVLYPERLGLPAMLYQRLTGFRDILTIGTCQEPLATRCEPGECTHSSTRGRPAILVLDEASAAFPSRDSSSVPTELLAVMQQLRKRDTQMVWTAPAYPRMDKFIREMTGAVTVCSSMMPDVTPRAIEVGDRRWFPDPAVDEHGERLPRLRTGWAPRRLFSFRTFEAQSYDEFTLSKTQKLRPRAKRWYWRNRHQAQHLYESLEGVSLLDHLTGTARCVDCGKKHRATYCECECCKSAGADRPARAVGGRRPAASAVAVGGGASGNGQGRGSIR